MNFDETNANDPINLLPRIFRTEGNKKFLNATLNQLVQPGTVKKISAFIGRQYSKSTTSADVFLEAPDSNRQNYQFEPAAVLKNEHDEVIFYKDYIDYINHIGIFGGNTSNHERLNKQEMYSWDPHISWDMFVNYQDYYWQQHGPKIITVYGQQREIQSTYNIQLIEDAGTTSFIFGTDAEVRNPDITLYRGQTYIFNINSPDNPFCIKDSRMNNLDDSYNSGLSANSITNGTITFKVGKNTPDILFYSSSFNPNIGGVFKIFNIEENTMLNIEDDILNKTNYVMSTGVSFANGMKVKFAGEVYPEIYKSGTWFVEGVGRGIKLIADVDLAITGTYLEEQAAHFDIDPFDTTAFGTSPLKSTDLKYAEYREYMVMNRASPDRNQWARVNRWFHRDVLILSEELNGGIFDLDQKYRGKRPIIEFQPGLKLFNFGHQAKKDVDLIDTITTDIFSKIQGSTGYYIDGFPLSEGMRVLFTADTDTRVKNNIYEIRFVDVNIPGKQLSFNVLDMDLINNTISFSTNHGLTDGFPITYLNNNNPSIEGLVSRKIYYPRIIDDNTIQLYLKFDITKQGDARFTNIVDLISRGSGIHTFELFEGLRHQITLTEVEDTRPLPNETIFVKYGVSYQGKMFWFNGDHWALGQSKTAVNQAPLFDVVDDFGNSLNDAALYPNSTFSGTKLFSYKIGSGTDDPFLGFPLSYRNINNIGDISFSFDLMKDIITYSESDSTVSKKLETGYLISIKSLNNIEYVNGWTKSDTTYYQPIIKIFKESGLINNFPLDVYDKINDVEVRVYKNGYKIDPSEVSLVTGTVYKIVQLKHDVLLTDIITLKCFSRQPKNSNGFYEIPVNLQNNPLNNAITELTLGQITDHVSSIVNNLPAPLTLKSVANLSKYGTRVVQHTGPLNSSLYHICNKESNVIEAIKQAQSDYRIFKISLINAITNSGVYTTAPHHLDHTLEQLFANKPKTSKYYLSDMFACNAYTSIKIEVLDSRTKLYPLHSPFNLDALSNKGVLVYVNNNQLIHKRDYEFTDLSFITIHATLSVGDEIEIREYSSTDGAICPPTPTKLGLYPKYEPKIYLDTTLITPVNVIQGHDGSIMVAFNDYRDDVILELEKRIFNNIKVQYNPDIFDIYQYLPGHARTTPYTINEVNQAMSSSFYSWLPNINADYTKNTVYIENNYLTYNFNGMYTSDNNAIPAYWRGIYRYLLDTDRPHLCPWEMLGYSIQPEWWESTYGPAPYTRDNTILWDDLKNGMIRDPSRAAHTDPKFARPILADGIPVNEMGQLLDPWSAGLIQGTAQGADVFQFGDVGPVESAWRRSSLYPFAVIQAALLLNPNQILGTCIDVSRIVRNKCGQFIYTATSSRLKLSDLLLPSNITDPSRIYTSGLINYITEFVYDEVGNRLKSYKYALSNLTNELSSRIGGFTSKEKYNVILDSKSPSSSGGIFVPEENYDIILNSSTAIKKVSYSGVIITKVAVGYEITGYNVDEPYFKYYTLTGINRTVRVGGISEIFVNWEPQQYYVVGKIVRYQNRYYRTSITHDSGLIFEPEYFISLPKLPTIGGVEVVLKKTANTTTIKTLNYGTILPDIQSVSDFLQGYGAYLESIGFIFKTIDNYATTVRTWESSINDFLFWTTQGWSNGSIISVSPGAYGIVLAADHAVVNDVFDPFYGYKIYDKNGKKIELNNISINRVSGHVYISSKTSTIYSATVYLIQKEHVLLLDNTTIFNDMIYDLYTGYKQDRVKVLGYVSTEWDGGFNVPGFIYDDAIIMDWEPWVDYHIGNTVRYKSFYYSAKSFIEGSEKFNPESWVLLPNKPTTKLLPNWDYRTNQFMDFYDLDTDNFDAAQQRMAQHLIGYQKREYLSNIINDDVSQYKFYQGMIIEKGTPNVFSKLFDVLSSDNKESVTFDEEWAVRVGRYGATDIFNEVEFTLDPEKFKLKPQPFLLVNELPSINPVDYIYRVPTDSISIKPPYYSPELWDTTSVKSPFLRSAGYVRWSDVDHAIDNLAILHQTDASKYNENEYVWCGFEDRSWNVYRIQNISYTTWEIFDNYVQLQLTSNHGIQSNDIIIFKTSAINTFASVDITGTELTVNVSSIASGTELTDPATIYIFKSCRFIDKLSADNSGEALVWIDSYTESSNSLPYWAVRKNGTIIHKQSHRADASVIKSAFLYNNASNTMIEHLDVVDIPNGKLPGEAEQELSYKTYYDPAIYSNGNDSVIVDDGLSWNNEHVGELWWDLTRAKFIVNDDDDVSYSASVWNQMFISASIDVYEWVESKYSPTEWDELSNTEAGLSEGISGTTKYGEDAYSVTTAYDPYYGTTINTYYFWVKNKQTLPSSDTTRRLSAAEVASLLTNPSHYGYKCISLLRRDAFILVNTDPYLMDENVVLCIQNWTSQNRLNNIHSEWKLVSENSNTTLPHIIEQKWIDSLIGIDFMGNQIPDPSLPVKLKYGIETKPRQGMFVNRLHALSLIINRLNQVLSTKQIVDNYDISKLLAHDPAPVDNTSKWDSELDTDFQIRYIDTSSLITATISLRILDGKIVGSSIVNPGRGYTNPPEIIVHSVNGIGAKFEVKLDSIGAITSIQILDTGYEYENSTTASVRPYSILIHNDSKSNGNWAIYWWDMAQAKFVLNATKSYDTTFYWEYSDWYETGYDQFTKIDYIVENTNKLMTSPIELGQIVKVLNHGVKGWLLVVRNSGTSAVDYTKNYDIVGREGGTIKFSNKLYSSDTNVTVELRNILEALRDDILIKDLRTEYLKLFFMTIRYLLSEQPLVDWVFKTSFVKATHNVGELKQKITYNNDNLQNFEDYISEVKPYRTKIRDFTSVYNTTEHSNTMVSDFDLPSTIGYDKQYYSIYNIFNSDGIYIDEDLTSTEPWKAWVDNVGFSVTDIRVIDGGDGYLSAPTVTLVSNHGSGAKAIAYLNNGKVNRIKVSSQGYGYLQAPTVVFSGGLSVGGRSARAVCIISNSLVRSNVITMKYDRISSTYEMSQLTATETFTGVYGKRQFELRWKPQLDHDITPIIVNGNTIPFNTSVTVNGIEVLFDQYTLSSKSKIIGGYTRVYGIITFDSPPSPGDVIIINYKKDFNHLSATDRINFYYSPVVGDYGKDLSQLMIGVDYAGTIVTGAALKTSQGWDTIEWDSDVWDSFEPTMDNFVTVVDYGVTKIKLPYVPLNNIQIASANQTTFNVKYNASELVVYQNGIKLAPSEFTATDGVKVTLKIGANAGDVLRFTDITVYIDDIRIDDQYTITTTGDTLVIPSDAYNQFKLKMGQVAPQYTDSNLTIMSDMVSMTNGITIIDQFNKSLYRSVRYYIQVIFDMAYTFDITVFHNGTDITLVTPLGSASFDDFCTKYGQFNAVFVNNNLVLQFVPSASVSIDLSQMQVIVIKWLFTDGNILELLTDGVNDTNFILSTDTFVVFEKEIQILDEFDINLFSSGCYYVQLVQGTNVQVCEIEVIHNGMFATIQVIDNNIISGLNECGKFTVAIDDDLLKLYVETFGKNTSIVYSRILLTGGIANPVRSDDIRRLSNDQFILTTFDFAFRNKETVIVDRFDTFKCSSVRYQILLWANDRTQSVDAIASVNGELLVVKNNLNVPNECGYFTAQIVSGEYRLMFTPVCKNVHINAVKFMMGYSYNSTETLLYDDIFTYDKISTKLSTISKVAIDSYSSTFHACQYQVQLIHNNEYHTCKLSVTHDGQSVSLVQYSDMVSIDILGVFDAELDNGRMVILVTPTLPSTNVVLLRLLIGPHTAPATKILSANNYQLKSNSISVSNMVATEITNFDQDIITSVDYYFLIETADIVSTVEVHIAHNGVDAYLTVYGMNGPEMGTFDVVVESGIVKVLFTGTYNDITLYWVETAISQNNQLAILPNSSLGLTDRNTLISATTIITHGYDPVTIDEFEITHATGGFYKILAVSGTNITVIELHLSHNSIIVSDSQYAILMIGESCGEFTCELSDNVVKILFTPAFQEVYVTAFVNRIDAQFRGTDVSNTNFESFFNFSTKYTVGVLKSTSDGSLYGQPFLYDADLGIEAYDSNLSGGSINPVLSTMVGFRPEDTIIDGNGLVNIDMPNGPEELLPGLITDTVAIKVYHRPQGGAPKLSYKNYRADGVTKLYSFMHTVPSERSIIVKIDHIIQPESAYKIHWDTNQIEFTSAAPINSIISIISIGFSSDHMLDFNTFIVQDSTIEYVTKAIWNDGNVKATVLVNGAPINFELYKVELSNQVAQMTGIRFYVPIDAGKRFTYMIETDDHSGIRTASITESETIQLLSSNNMPVTEYPLTILTAGVLENQLSEPFTNSVLVKLGNKILRPNPVFYFTMTKDSTGTPIKRFRIPKWYHMLGDITIDNLEVYRNNTRTYRFTFDQSTNEVVFDTYKDNATVVISINVNSDYVITSAGTIKFTSLTMNDVDTIGNVEVISFYNHVVLHSERTTDNIKLSSSIVPTDIDYIDYTLTTGRYFILRKPIVSVEYAWVIKNGELLTHDMDYVLDDDKQTIILRDNILDGDSVQIISFIDRIIGTTFGFMQFKDIFDRFHYRRLNKAKSTTLSNDLKPFDTQIEVVDASVLSSPTGVVEINGERIEYQYVEGNLLKGLHRGTMGTGVPAIHRFGLNVLDIGPTEALPYIDQYMIDTIISKRTTVTVPTRYVAPTSGQTDKAHPSSQPTDSSIYSTSDAIDVFVGGTKMIKYPYTVFDESKNYPYSPEGDRDYPEQFRVNGISPHVRLTTPIPKGIQVTVIKKQGRIWTDAAKTLSDSETNIAKFLKNTETTWPQYLLDKYQYTILADSSDILKTDDNNVLEGD